MKGVIRVIDTLNTWIGKTMAWLLLPIVLITAYQVITRHFFKDFSNALLDTTMYMHAAVFMLGAAYTLLRDEHVRVDVFYRGMSPRNKALANLFGSVFFLLPFAFSILYFSWTYVGNSWSAREISSQVGGLPYVYVLKTLIPLFAVLLILQGIAEILRNIMVLKGKIIIREEV